MNLENGIKELIGFIVRNGLYNKAGIKKTLETLKNLGKMKLAGIVNETAPKQEIVEYPVYAVLIPKGVLGNIWEFHGVYGTMVEAAHHVEEAIIGTNPIWSKYREKVEISQTRNHTNYNYITYADVKAIASINRYNVRFA